jgi:ABC-2 type transport system ATP-binding protein
MLAGVLARDTRLLLLDEPASPLDPLMREKLCDMIGDYISAENGKTRGNAGNAGNREDGENRENAENKGNIDLGNIDLENINLNRSVLFSTHNVSDMESITDYAIIMDDGRILERGFVEDLKEKYVYIHAEPEDSDKVKQCFVSYSESKYGIEGLALTEDAAKFSDLDITAEIPTLYQISVGVMKTATKLKIR